MANYAVSNILGGTQQAISSSFKTLVSVTSSSATQARRGQVYDVIVGTNGTPADNYMTFDISRQTATGTSTSITPTLLNPADAAMLGVATANSTAEPTITANSSLLYFGLNQRATQRWIAAPGSELVYPATTANGFALRALSGSYTGTATGEMLVTEL